MSPLLITAPIGCFLIGFFLGLDIGWDRGAKLMENTMRGHAIKHGTAYYHPQTGAFTWKDENKP